MSIRNTCFHEIKNLYHTSPTIKIQNIPSFSTSSHGVIPYTQSWEIAIFITVQSGCIFPEKHINTATGRSAVWLLSFGMSSRFDHVVAGLRVHFSLLNISIHQENTTDSPDYKHLAFYEQVWIHLPRTYVFIPLKLRLRSEITESYGKYMFCLIVNDHILPEAYTFKREFKFQIKTNMLFGQS